MEIYLHTNLALLRTLRKASQQRVADMLEVKRSTYSTWEYGVSQPSIANLMVLGQWHRLSLDILVGKDLLDLRPSQIEELQRAY